MLVVNRHFNPISYRSSVICDFCLIYGHTGNDVVPVSPLGGVKSQILYKIQKGNYRLCNSGKLKILLYHASFPSYKRFMRCREQTGSDVTPISPLVGATRKILWQILKGDQRL